MESQSHKFKSDIQNNTCCAKDVLIHENIPFCNTSFFDTSFSNTSCCNTFCFDTSEKTIFDYAVIQSGLDTDTYQVSSHYWFPNSHIFVLCEPHGADGIKVMQFCRNKISTLLFNKLNNSDPDSHAHTPYTLNGYESEKVDSMSLLIKGCFNELQNSLFNTVGINSDYSGISLCLIAIFGRHMYIANTGGCMCLLTRLRPRSVLRETNEIIKEHPDKIYYLDSTDSAETLVKYTMQKPLDPSRHIRRSAQNVHIQDLLIKDRLSLLEKEESDRVIWPFFVAYEQTLDQKDEYKRITKHGGNIHYPTNITIIKSLSVKKHITKATEEKLCNLTHPRPLLIDTQRRTDIHKTCLFPSTSRSLGDRHATKLGITADPVVYYHYIEKKDKNIILGSNGFWKMISALEVADISSDMHCDASKGVYIMSEQVRKRWNSLCVEMGIVKPSFSVFNISITFKKNGEV